MSSMILSPKHYQSVKNSTIALFKAYYGSQHDAIYPYFTKDTVPELWNDYCKPDENVAYSKIITMVDIMAELNVRCVNLQYANRYANVDAEIANDLLIMKTKSVGLDLSKIQLYKAIQCVFYQIELEHLTAIRELTNDEKQAIKFFEELNVEIAENVVKNTAEYDTAKWSIE